MSNPMTITEQLVELFNNALAQSGNSTEYTEEDLTFAAPVAYEEGTVDESEPEAHNTSVLVTAGEDFTQVTYNLHYHRLNLERLFAPREPSIEVAVLPATTHDILEELSEHVGFELTETDVQDLPIANGVITVRAVAASLAVMGEAQILVTEPDPG